MHKVSFQAIGTLWTIETSDQLPTDIQRTITNRIEQFDKTYSRFREDALVAQLRTPGTYEFPDDAMDLVAFYRQLYETTDGAMTPLVGGILEQAGYDAAYSLQPKAQIQAVPKWDNVMNWTGRQVIVKEPIVLDIGAAGKGYLVDIIAKIFGSHNINDYIIDASGDVRQRGRQPTRIGLENPYDLTRVIGMVEIHNQSLCASATNRRAWAGWHHVIDPQTSLPVRDIVATWVIATTTMVADGVATALFFVAPERLGQWDFQAVRLFADGRIEQTDNFVGELYI